MEISQLDFLINKAINSKYAKESRLMKPDKSPSYVCLAMLSMVMIFKNAVAEYFLKTKLKQTQMPMNPTPTQGK